VKGRPLYVVRSARNLESEGEDTEQGAPAPLEAP
jgi:hypothetical protein